MTGTPDDKKKKEVEKDGEKKKKVKKLSLEDLEDVTGGSGSDDVETEYGPKEQVGH